MNVFEIVTDRVCASLLQGEIPWQRPWCTVTGGAYNRVSGRSYSLMNQMLLVHSGEYATYAQWEKLGGKVRKGEKGEIVVFWKFQEAKKEEEDETEEENRPKKPVLRYYTVYHISQVDGVAPLEPKNKLYEHDPIEQAENLVHGYIMREKIRLEDEPSNWAYYSPVQDVIHIPAMSQYEYPEDYYSTILHEIVHSTGHMNRLNRPGLQTVAFGSESYSKEECVAEIGCAALMNQLGIETDHSIKNSNAYIQGWLKALRNEKKKIVYAACAAEKALRYIMAET